MRNYIEQAVEEICAQVGQEHVVLGLSGGVDSERGRRVVAQSHRQTTHLHLREQRSVPRPRSEEVVQQVFGKISRSSCNTRTLPRSSRKPKASPTPEQKRKIIGKTFIEVFQAFATKRAGKAKFLAQGTLYPMSSSPSPIAGNPAALIKSHHNVGGLPKNMKFQLVEPLKCLFKDEVRLLGEELGVPKEIVWRQPFPGPGLGVRILGEVTPAALRDSPQRRRHRRRRDESQRPYYKIWQSFAVLLPVRSVGVMVMNAPTTSPSPSAPWNRRDGMTADWVKLPLRPAGETRQPYHQ